MCSTLIEIASMAETNYQTTATANNASDSRVKPLSYKFKGSLPNNRISFIYERQQSR